MYRFRSVLSFKFLNGGLCWENDQIHDEKVRAREREGEREEEE